MFFNEQNATTGRTAVDLQTKEQNPLNSYLNCCKLPKTGVVFAFLLYNLEKLVRRTLENDFRLSKMTNQGNGLEFNSIFVGNKTLSAKVQSSRCLHLINGSWWNFPFLVKILNNKCYLTGMYKTGPNESIIISGVFVFIVLKQSNMISLPFLTQGIILRHSRGDCCSNSGNLCLRIPWDPRVHSM